VWTITPSAGPELKVAVVLERGSGGGPVRRESGSAVMVAEQVAELAGRMICCWGERGRGETCKT